MNSRAIELEYFVFQRSSKLLVPFINWMISWTIISIFFALFGLYKWQILYIIFGSLSGFVSSYQVVCIYSLKQMYQEEEELAKASQTSQV